MFELLSLRSAYNSSVQLQNFSILSILENLKYFLITLFQSLSKFSLH